jgi:hypothetical protein
MQTRALLTSVLSLGVLSLGALALGTSSVSPAVGPVDRAAASETAIDADDGAVPAQASCGDYRCSPPEDCNSCPQDCGDCCGDRRCAPPEDCNSCPEDCGRC